MIIRLYTLLLSLVLIFNFSNAQTTSSCFEIQSILVDACGSPEGVNEMARFLVGPNPLNTSTLSVTWGQNPTTGGTSNTWRGVCGPNADTDARVAFLNSTILRCGYILQPVGGVLPPNAKVIIVTSDTFNAAVNPFTNLTDTIYMIFQCRGNTGGHFVNYNATPGTLRRLIMNFGGGCIDTVMYDANQLVNQSGVATGSPAATRDGASVRFAFNGTASYFNNGCQAPIPVSSVTIATNSGADTAVCPSSPAFNLRGVVSGVQSVRWFTTGSGSFSDSSSLNPTYTTSPTDIYPISFYLVGYLGCNDSLIDTIRAIPSPNTIDAGANTSLCAGSSVIVFAAGGSGYTWSPPTYVSNVNSATPTLSPPITSTFYISGTYGPGCVGQDSIVITVNIQDTILLNVTDTSICRGQSVNISSSNVSAITYSLADGLSCTNCLTTIATPLNSITYTATSSGICPDTRTIQINIDTAVSIVNPPIVACGAYSFNGNIFTTSTTLLDTIQNSRGCDSIWISIPLTVLPLNRDTVSICINQGQSVFVGGANQNTSGFYNDTLAASIGCDTVLVTELIVVTPQVVNDTLSSCYQVVFNGQTFTSSSLVRDTVFTILGCIDSIYNTTITIANITVNTNRTVCILQGQSFFIGGANQTSSGVYIDTLLLPSGCDSIITTTLEVKTVQINNSSLSACNQLVFNGNTYSSSTLVRDTIRGLLGCDSVYNNTNITIFNNNSQTNRAVCILQGQSLFVGGALRTTSGIYRDTITLSTGCDSVIETALQVVNTVTITQNISGCGLVNFNGTNYTSSITLRDTVLAGFGCDSIYNAVNIVISPISAVNTNQVCINFGQRYFAGGANQTTSGIYRDTLTNISGCDSVIITDLRVVTIITKNQQLNVCDSARVGGITYFSDTTFNSIIQTSLGCDSVVNITTIDIHPTYSYEITADKPMPIDEGETVVLNSNFNGTSLYFEWSPSLYILSGGDEASVVIRPENDVVYTMDYFVSDSFCKQLDTFRVTVKKIEPRYILPNAFSPNGDGNNDLFRVILESGLSVEYFRIYNRWGELVFIEQGTSKGWDGKYKEVDQPVGAYIYYITVRNLSTGKIKSSSGNVTLLR